MTTEPELERDEYPEPLWDPIASEVRLLIREYFAEADAEREAAEAEQVQGEC